MKRQSSAMRLRSIRLTIKRTRKKKNRLRFKKRKKSEKLSHEVVIAPPIFFVGEEHGGSLSRFISDLHRACASGRVVDVDFTNTKKIYASAGLLMYAEIRNCFYSYDAKIQCIPPRNNKVSQVFKQIGLYDFLKKRISVSPTAHDVVQWRFATGKKVDGKQYENVLSEYDGRIADSLKDGLYVGITEAMSNCLHHAHIAPRKVHPTDTSSESWWMFSQEKDDKLSVVFCDLGVGIPSTLAEKQPAWWDKILDFLGNSPTDGAIIDQAVQLSRSRTGLSHRGKGLFQLASFVQKHPNSTLLILSNKGGYSVRHGEESAHFNSRTSINGTLIQWTVPLCNGEKNV